LHGGSQTNIWLTKSILSLRFFLATAELVTEGCQRVIILQDLLSTHYFTAFDIGALSDEIQGDIFALVAPA